MAKLHLALETNEFAPAKSACGSWLDGLHPNGRGGVIAIPANVDRRDGFARWDAQAARPSVDPCRRCANTRQRWARQRPPLAA